MHFLTRIFRLPRPMQYDYKPRFYRPESEWVQQIRQRYTPADDTQKNIEQRIRMHFQSRFSAYAQTRRRLRRQSNIRVLVIALILLIAAVILIGQYLDKLIDWLE